MSSIISHTFDNNSHELKYVFLAILCVFADSFGRDRDGGSIKKRLSEGLSASRPPPRTAETEPHAVVSEEAVAMEVRVQVL